MICDFLFFDESGVIFTHVKNVGLEILKLILFACKD